MTANHEHTPTTEQVRGGYSRKPPGHAVLKSRERQAAEFDRWLAERDARITAAAEQRGAIKALRRVAKDLEWLGAQGNIPTPDTSWQGVLECIRIINSEALTIEYRADRIANKEEGE